MPDSAVVARVAALLFVAAAVAVATLAVFDQYGTLRTFSADHVMLSLDFNARRLYFFEFDTKEHLKRLCRARSSSDFTFVDVGAHNGDTALAVVPRVKNIHAVCIEPSAEKVAFINALVAANGLGCRIKTRINGVSNERRCGSIDKRTQFGFVDSAQHRVSGSGDDFDVILLDDIDFEYPVRVINLDVEGMELEALKGAEALLARDRPDLVVEVAHASECAIDAFLRPLGYCKSGWRTKRNVHWRNGKDDA